jgi:hypothetical protein
LSLGEVNSDPLTFRALHRKRQRLGVDFPQQAKL